MRKHGHGMPPPACLSLRVRYHRPAVAVIRRTGANAGGNSPCSRTGAVLCPISVPSLSCSPRASQALLAPSQPLRNDMLKNGEYPAFVPLQAVSSRGANARRGTAPLPRPAAYSNGSANSSRSLLSNSGTTAHHLRPLSLLHPRFHALSAPLQTGALAHLHGLFRVGVSNGPARILVNPIDLTACHAFVLRAAVARLAVLDAVATAIRAWRAVAFRLRSLGFP